MAVLPVIINWKGKTNSTRLAQGVTPPARLEYLLQLNDRVTAALTAYAAPGVCSLMGGRYFKVPVPPATKALQARAVVAWGSSAKSGAIADAPADVSVYADGSGGTAADEITIPVSNPGEGDLAMPPDGPWSLVTASETWQPTPAAAQDRLCEYTATLAGAGLEGVAVDECVGVCFRPYRASDLSSL